MFSGMTAEQEYYVSGLSDALEIVKQHYNNMYQVGKIYYVIVKDNYRDCNTVQRMILYRINQTPLKTSYCFSSDFVSKHIPHPDLILYSEQSLRLRVYRTMEEAKRNLQIAFTNRREFYK